MNEKVDNRNYLSFFDDISYEIHKFCNNIWSRKLSRHFNHSSTLQQIQLSKHNYSQTGVNEYEEPLASFNHYLLHDFFNHVQDEPGEFTHYTHLGTYLTGEEDWVRLRW